MLAHGGEHVEDWTSLRLSAPFGLDPGSCAKSGMVSQTIMRLFEYVRAAQVLDATSKEPEGSVTVV